MELRKRVFYFIRLFAIFVFSFSFLAVSPSFAENKKAEAGCTRPGDLIVLPGEENAPEIVFDGPQVPFRHAEFVFDSPQVPFRRVEFEFDAAGQLTKLILTKRGKDADAAFTKEVALGEGRTFNFSYSAGLPRVSISQKGRGDWIFSGYDCYEESAAGEGDSEEDCYYVTVSGFGDETYAYESGIHDSVYNFVRDLKSALNLDAAEIGLINFDEHHDNYRPDIPYVNSGNWAWHFKYHNLVSELIWVYPGPWYEPSDEVINKAKWSKGLKVYDYVTGDPQNLKANKPLLFITIDFDYLSSTESSTKIYHSSPQEILAVVDALSHSLAQLRGQKHKIVGINFVRDPGYSYKPYNNFILNALVNRCVRALGVVKLKRVPCSSRFDFKPPSP